MKKFLLTLAILLPITSFAMGGVVEVTNTVANIQGVGTLKPSDMQSIITYKNGSLTQSSLGQITSYDLSNAGINPTDYTVIAPFIPDYEYTIAGDCSGTVSDDKLKMCFLQWTDTGTSMPPVIVQASEPMPLPIVSEPIVTLVPTNDNPEQIQALQEQLIGLLKQLISILTQLHGYKTT